MKRTIVCAAMRNTDGQIICSPRHYDKMCVAQMNMSPNTMWAEAEQGFVDQYCEFLSRTEAWKVAFDGGQIVRRCGGDTTDNGTLYSENLY